MARGILSVLKQTQKAVEGPGSVCIMCGRTVGSWHKQQKQLASCKIPGAKGE